MAASLPDTRRRPCRSPSTGTLRPRGSTPTPEPEYPSAARVTRARSREVVCSTTSSAVITFVRLATARRSRGRRRHSTSPVSRSKSSPARGGRRKRTPTVSGRSSRTAEGWPGAGTAAWAAGDSGSGTRAARVGASPASSARHSAARHASPVSRSAATRRCRRRAARLASAECRRRSRRRMWLSPDRPELARVSAPGAESGGDGGASGWCTTGSPTVPSGDGHPVARRRQDRSIRAQYTGRREWPR
jgi:hypothetical protein